MKTKIHFVASLLISIPLFLYGDFLPGIAVVFAGWLIDADHEVDYYIFMGRFAYNPLRLNSDLGRGLCSENKNKMFVPFHAWEWLVLMVFLGVDPLIMTSYAVHLILDVFGNKIHTRCYSILWRQSNGWKIVLRE